MDSIRLGKRRRFRHLFLLPLAAALFITPPAAAASEIAVCFTPEYGGAPSCTQRIVNAIGQAKRSILVQAYSFTSAPIAKALVEAHRRGVEVKAILDSRANGEHYSEATFLQHMGIPVLIDSRHAIAHNKVMVVDGSTVITGSFNFTKAAEEHNAENLLIIRDPELAARYAQNWNVHASHSRPFGAAREVRQDDRERDAEGRDPANGETGKSGEIVGNKKSHIYALPGCPTYNRMSPANRVVFPNIQTAEQAGYRIARNCH